MCVCAVFLSLTLSLLQLSAIPLAPKSLPPCLFIYLAASKRSSSAEGGVVRVEAHIACVFNGKMLEITTSVLGYLPL